MISRRVLGLATASIVLLAFDGLPAFAGDSDRREITVPGTDGGITARLFAAPGDGKRPAVIILHGARGLARFHGAYARYAQSIAARGMDALLLSYYSGADADTMASTDRAVRTAYFDAHLGIWTDRVRALVGLVTERGESNGKAGLLGFSNGGFLAVASAAADPRINAIVVYYGGIPAHTDPAHLPPLLALHGDADRTIPVADGAALVEKARALGGPADLIIYPGAGHGFDFDATRADARDASDRALRFLEQQLK
jgi:carboxymethylenebutenolidase